MPLRTFKNNELIMLLTFFLPFYMVLKSKVVLRVENAFSPNSTHCNPTHLSSTHTHIFQRLKLTDLQVGKLGLR